MALMHQFVASDNDRPQLQSGCQSSYVQVNYILAQMTQQTFLLASLCCGYVNKTDYALLSDSERL